MKRPAYIFRNNVINYIILNISRFDSIYVLYIYLCINLYNLFDMRQHALTHPIEFAINHFIYSWIILALQNEFACTINNLLIHKPIQLIWIDEPNKNLSVSRLLCTTWPDFLVRTSDVELIWLKTFIRVWHEWFCQTLREKSIYHNFSLWINYIYLILTYTVLLYWRK